MQPHDYAVPNLKWILGFIGITDITVRRIGETAIPGIQETAVEKGMRGIVL
jgi:FMN-dependent NADH-azoreductase